MITLINAHRVSIYKPFSEKILSNILLKLMCFHEFECRTSFEQQLKIRLTKSSSDVNVFRFSEQNNLHTHKYTTLKNKPLLL